MRGFHPDGTHARQVYNLEEMRDALTRYALCGNYAQVERETGIAGATIKAWRTETQTELWTRIRDMVEEQVGDRIAGVISDRLDLLEQSRDALRAAYKANDTGKIKDLAAADRNLGVSAGLAVDKSRTIREKPSFIVQQRIDPAEIASELARMNPELAKQLGVLVDVEAEEIVDAQLEPPTESVYTGGGKLAPKKPKPKPRAKPKAKPKAKRKPAKVKPK